MNIGSIPGIVNSSLRYIKKIYVFNHPIYYKRLVKFIINAIKEIYK